jgi:hypothetical protein
MKRSPRPFVDRRSALPRDRIVRPSGETSLPRRVSRLIAAVDVPIQTACCGFPTAFV